ncbi:MAG: hypothetical protein KKF62_09140 [Bacteroidetes bacterium]|nr:hypothetical protein [Bacteroidota bacterium]MBU1116542.1 hypothetical protein [Bacteroidota bacterium]MBU1796838.1 hypothetical protein [Bacteroidota bacterium]
MNLSEDANNYFLNEQNKKKKKEIEDKYDATFHKPDDSDLSPALENEFLNYIQQFEEQFETTDDIEVLEYLGNPIFKKLEEILPNEIESEIEKVLNIYFENNVNIHVSEESEITDAEYYTFLTEELPKHKMQNMRISGMNINFIYEEFHPSIKLDSKMAIEDTLLSAISKNREYGMTFVSNENLHNSEGKSISKIEFKNSLYKLFDDVDEIIEKEFVFNKFEFGNENIVNTDFIIRYKQKKSFNEIDKVFNFMFWLTECEYGGMEIVRCKYNF